MNTYEINLLIDNKEVPGVSYKEAYDSGDLSQVVARVAQAGENEINKAVESAHKAYQSWKHVNWKDRAALLLKAADILEQEADLLAEIGARESGIVFQSQKWEVLHSADAIRQVVKEAEAFFVEEHVENERCGSMLLKHPRGVVAALIPWNVPIMMTVDNLAPALITGNTIVIKPSKSACVPLAIALQKIAKLFPDGVLNVVHGGGGLLPSHPLVKMVVLTGGTETGKIIARGAADNLQRYQLELGGNDPGILLEDADLSKAVPNLIYNAFHRSGQICVAVKRMYVPRKLYDKVKEMSIAEVNKYKIGYALDPEATMGAVNNEEQYEYVKGLIQRARDAGREVIECGTILDSAKKLWDKGYYHRPTLVFGAEHDDELVVNEQFGPVLPVVAYDDIEDVIRWANDSEFGLGSKVWAGDYKKALAIAERLEVGMTTINGGCCDRLEGSYNLFGGVKQSGIGFKGGNVGLMLYMDYHTVNYTK